ncbi:PIN domain-containing protein [soil metagenome]
MIVVDASVVAPAFADDGDDGDQARGRLRAERIVVPELLDLEVVSVIRKHLIAGALDERRALLALDDLASFSATRVRHRVLIDRVWELCSNMTPYDASYVALAELTDAVLVTADGRLARASGARCDVDLLEPAAD